MLPMAAGYPFASLFGRSPFKPVQEHMRTVKKCVGQVTKLFEALCAGDHKKVAEIKTKIFELENEADAIKNELRAHLPKSLFMPVDRRDLLEVLDLQDSIADTAQDIAGLLVERRMEVANYRTSG
jgi:predicted phosphate transport protein (TIGR00153 family)